MEELKDKWSMTEQSKEKIYFSPGDVVTIRQNIPYKPIMLVKGKVQKTIRNSENSSNHFQGIECIWFTVNGELQKSTFNTKDLEFVHF